MTVEVLPATEEHARELAAVMRREDTAEVNALGRDPLGALLGSLAASTVAFTAKFNGKVATMWGVGPAEGWGPSCGEVWLLSGAPVAQHPRAFLKLCRLELPELLQAYPVLLGTVDARYRRAVEWVQWLGFELRAVMPIGRNGEEFHLISMRGPQWES